MPPKNKWIYAVLLTVFVSGIACSSLSNAAERDRGEIRSFLQKIREKRQMLEEKKPEYQEKGLYLPGSGKSNNETLGDRSFIVYVPPSLPRAGDIPMLVALHGGFGNAKHLQEYSGFDPLADKHGFIVVYMNGTPVGTRAAKFLGWNAGGCCGQPYKIGVDDLGFIAGAIDFVSDKYGVDKRQVYGTGHSNGAMMSMRVMCETDLYQSAAVYSGALQMDREECPRARGNTITNIHGTEDFNLPIEGGHTSVGFNKETDYKSQDYTRDVFERSGARYNLILVEGADHSPETINDGVWAQKGISLPQLVVSELGLDRR